MGFNDMISIQIGHFSVTLDPNLMLAIFGQVVKTSDVKPKLSSLRELAHE